MTAHVQWSPAETDTTGWPETTAGTVVCPWLELPQHSRAPDAFTAHEWAQPAASLRRPDTTAALHTGGDTLTSVCAGWVGGGGGAVNTSGALPQHVVAKQALALRSGAHELEVRLLCTAQVVYWPADTANTARADATAAGGLASPETSLPQHSRPSWSPRRAHV